jgi:hypothetical protein
MLIDRVEVNVCSTEEKSQQFCVLEFDLSLSSQGGRNHRTLNKLIRIISHGFHFTAHGRQTVTFRLV